MNNFYQGVTDWDERNDPTGLFMSEKFDGEFARWDGKQLLTKNFNIIHAPEWWTATLPKTHQLDGELYMGRGMFQKTISVVRRSVKIQEKLWEKIAYMVWDSPNKDKRSDQTWINRVVRLEAKHPTVPVPHFMCHSLSHMQEFYASIVDNRGEGIILRKPNSLYEWKKESKNACRLVPVKRATGKIVAHNRGQGKYSQMLGSYEVEDFYLQVRFSVGSGLNEQDRENPLPIGSELKYKYRSLTDDGIPKFPTIDKEENN